LSGGSLTDHVDDPHPAVTKVGFGHLAQVRTCPPRIDMWAVSMTDVLDSDAGEHKPE